MRDQREVLVIKGAFLAQAYSSNASQIKSRAGKDVGHRESKKVINWHFHAADIAPISSALR